MAAVAFIFALASAVAPFALAAVAVEPSPAALDAAARRQFPVKPHSGFSLAVVHGGHLTYARGYGFRDDGTPDTYIPVDRNYYELPIARGAATRALTDARTIYQIGSVTKQFTAAAILLLAEQHRLTLDDPVGTYVPAFTDRALTLRVLLHQRSGLPDHNALTFIDRVRPLARRRDGSIDTERVNRELAALPRHFATGSRFEYSNSNYFVLSTVVERITGVSLGAFLDSSFFRPLGMSRTAYATTAARDDVAVGYRTDDKNVVRRAYPFDLAWLGGAGAMTSTVEDLSRWNLALLSKGRLQPASLREMWQGVDSGLGQGSYAMGWVEDALGSHRYLWHNGQTGGFHALNVIFPNDNLAFSILSNNQDARPEFLVPGIASLYFPVSGIDRVLPRSGVELLEASLAIGIGALAIALVVLVALKRFIVLGIVLALAAFVLGFALPSFVGYLLGFVGALVPAGVYAAAARFMPRHKSRPA